MMQRPEQRHEGNPGEREQPEPQKAGGDDAARCGGGEMETAVSQRGSDGRTAGTGAGANA